MTLAPALMASDMALTERATANLIDNALRHKVAAGSAVLTLANTGPEVPLTDIARLIQPFRQRVEGGQGISRMTTSSESILAQDVFIESPKR